MEERVNYHIEILKELKENNHPMWQLLRLKYYDHKMRVNNLLERSKKNPTVKTLFDQYTESITE